MLIFKEPQKLKSLMLDAIKKGLEGLVLKDTKVWKIVFLP